MSNSDFDLWRNREILEELSPQPGSILTDDDDATLVRRANFSAPSSAVFSPPLVKILQMPQIYTSL